MNFKGGSRRHGSRSHPCAVFIRFTESEQKDLAKLLRKRGLTMQAFSHAAIMRALKEANLGKKADGEIEHEEPQRRREAPQGLGIRDRLRANADDDDYDDDRRSVPSTTVTTNTPVLAQARTIDDEILALARTVVNSPQTARKEVLRAACRSLVQGRSQDEAVRLADDLDAAIRRIEGVPQTALERVRARSGR